MPTVSQLSSSGVSSATLAEGREIFTRSCTACHSMQPLAGHSLPEWQLLVEEMAPRTNLSPERKSALMAYITAAKAG